MRLAVPMTFDRWGSHAPKHCWPKKHVHRGKVLHSHPAPVQSRWPLFNAACMLIGMGSIHDCIGAGLSLKGWCLGICSVQEPVPRQAANLKILSTFVKRSCCVRMCPH